MKKIFAGLVAACCLFSGLLTACDKKTDGEIYVYAPDGAPALALAYAMYSDKKDDGVTYEVVNASTIETYLTYSNEQKNADLCVLPLNTASKLVGSGENYQLLGAVTHGNLYMLSTQSSQYSRGNLSSLVGKTVGVVQLQNVPGIVFKVILNDLGIPFCLLQNDDAVDPEKVNLRAVTPDQVAPTEGIDLFVAPEPAASVKAKKTALEFVGDLQELYGGERGYPQAVLVAKRSLIEKKGEFVDSFLKKVEDGEKWLETAETSAICSAISAHLTKGLTPSLTVDNLSREAIARSGVWFSSAQEGKAEINGILAKMIAVGGAASPVEEEFFAK
ncbi:MAG: hypothetical protein IJ506_08230 [Clostridia bacterium]|nr:hypothetical protein [Clostridia bacterium]